MREVKIMLLGITILILTIFIRFFVDGTALVTDVLGILIALIIISIGFIRNRS